MRTCCFDVGACHTSFALARLRCAGNRADMSGLEASENACLVFRGSGEESQQTLNAIVSKRLKPNHQIMQVC